MTKPLLDSSILNAALQGLESKKQELESHIAEVRRLLGTRRPGMFTVSDGAQKSRPRKKFSAATRRKMAESQRRRYAALRGEAAAPSQTATRARPKKRRISAEGLANIRAAVKRRWAAAKKSAPAKTRPAVRTVPTLTRRTAKRAAKKVGPRKMTTPSAVPAGPSE